MSIDLPPLLPPHLPLLLRPLAAMFGAPVLVALAAWPGLAPGAGAQEAGGYAPTSLAVDPGLPRTPEGRPDFQGEVWTSDFFPMLEESGMAGTLVISREKVTEIMDTLAAGMRRRTSFSIDPEAEDLVVDTKDGLPVVRGQQRSRMVVWPADGKLPYTEAARREMKETDPIERSMDDPEARPLSERCIGMAGLAPNTGTAGVNFVRFVQTPEHVVIQTEYGGQARVIPFAQAHQPKEMHAALGDAIARWEDETLVIETVSLPDEDRVRPFPQFIVSADATVVERYTRVTADELVYQFTVIDPAVYESEWLGEYSLVRTDERMFGPGCHEENYSLENILKAARQAELRRAD